MASTGAGIREGFARLRNEFPLVSAGEQRQLQDAERFEGVDFAIRANDSERTKILAAGSHDEFAYAAAGIGSAIRILRSEAFVIVVMSVDDYVGVGLVENVPQRFHKQVVAVGAAGTEKRLVKIGEGARYGMRGQIFAQPFALNGIRVASARRHTFAVQDDDVPRAELVAVITFARIPGALAEILEIISGAGGMEFVISGRRAGAIFHAAPGFIVALEIGGGAVGVSEIADGHHSAGSFVEQVCGSFGSGEVATIGDVAGSDEDRGGFGFRGHSSRRTALGSYKNEQTHENQKKQALTQWSPLDDAE